MLNSSVLSHHQNDVSDGTALSEEEIQAYATATGNAWSPSADRPIDKTSRVGIAVDQR